MSNEYKFSENHLKQIFDSKKVDINSNTLFNVSIKSSELDNNTYIKTLKTYLPTTRNVTVENIIETLNEGLPIKIVCTDDPLMYAKIYIYLLKFKIKNNIVDDENIELILDIIKNNMGDSLEKLFSYNELKSLTINNPFDDNKLNNIIYQIMERKYIDSIEHSKEDIEIEINKAIAIYNKEANMSRNNELTNIDNLLNNIGNSIDIKSTNIKSINEKLNNEKKDTCEKIYVFFGKNGDYPNGLKLNFPQDIFPKIIEQDILFR